VPEEKTKFWEDRWQSFIDASPLSKRRNPNGGRIKRWNKMAAGFAERTSEKQSADKRLKIIQMKQSSNHKGVICNETFSNHCITCFFLDVDADPARLRKTGNGRRAGRRRQRDIPKRL
jgi:hypothetical protein